MWGCGCNPSTVDFLGDWSLIGRLLGQLRERLNQRSDLFHAPGRRYQGARHKEQSYDRRGVRRDREQAGLAEASAILLPSG